MSSIDPGKLKVVELRAELSSRGLDSKGNKPVLVKRLKEALEKELETEIPDTSILDTSTEDSSLTLDKSVIEEPDDSKETPSKAIVSDKPEPMEVQTEEIKEEKLPSPKKEEKEAQGDSVPIPDKKEEIQELNKTNENGENNVTIKENIVEKEDKANVKDDIKLKDVIETKEDVKEIETKADIKEIETKADIKEIETKEDIKKREQIEEDILLNEEIELKEDGKDEPIIKDVTMTEEINTKEENKVNEIIKDEIPEVMENIDSDEVQDKEMDTKPTSEEVKGEKRRRSSPSPDRVQRKRSKSPVKEDEPELDNNKVQLSWYDSDLHLQIDKQSFLSGKPYHEGAFGYAWAGVRATHGAKSGKVCFELKITDELKWDDLVKQSEKRKETHKSDSGKRERQRSSSKSESDSKKSDKHEESESKKSDTSIKPESDSDSKQEKSEDEPEIDSDKNEKEKKESKTDEKRDKTDEKRDNTDEKRDNTDEKRDETSAEALLQPEMIPKHLLRVGWSTVDSNLQLGEDEFSYGYDSSGKFVSNLKFVDYGEKFGVGDVIGVFANIENEQFTLTFTLNGNVQPVATTVSLTETQKENFALFPHVLTRNYVFELNTGAKETPWFPNPPELSDYCYLEAIDDKVIGPQRPENRNDCEVIMMCGLPGSGKTHWVKEYVKDNIDKKYTVIGNTHLLEKMTVNGIPLKNFYKGRWNIILDRLMKCVNALVDAASLRRRNFIIDQTNVFPSAQRRKMRLFEGFKRRAVVVVVGDEEQAKRRALQEAQDGKDVPDSAILEMKANMSLPRCEEWLEEVTYLELNEEESKAIVHKYNQQGRDAGFGPMSGQRSNYRDHRDHPYRWDHSTSRRDYRGGYRDNRSSYQTNRYDRSRQQGWQNRRPPPGSWNRDIRRDTRGPSNGSRDFRSSRSSGGGSSGRQERSGNRENRNRSQSNNNFNRNQRSQGNRSQNTNWQGSSSWHGQGNWNSQNMWSQGNWNQGNWSSQTPQWKSNYSQGGYNPASYGNYPSWNYYGQYPQNWNSQGQPQTTTADGVMDSQTYNQYSQQATWAQYAQQYVQDPGMSEQQSSIQK